MDEPYSQHKRKSRYIKLSHIPGAYYTAVRGDVKGCFPLPARNLHQDGDIRFLATCGHRSCSAQFRHGYDYIDRNMEVVLLQTCFWFPSRWKRPIYDKPFLRAAPHRLRARARAARLRHPSDPLESITSTSIWHSTAVQKKQHHEPSSSSSISWCI